MGLGKWVFLDTAPCDAYGIHSIQNAFQCYLNYKLNQRRCFDHLHCIIIMARERGTAFAHNIFINWKILHEIEGKNSKEYYLTQSIAAFYRCEIKLHQKRPIHKHYLVFAEHFFFLIETSMFSIYFSHLDSNPCCSDPAISILCYRK